MKTVGLIGGMSWESTLEYYREINLGIKKTLGGLHSGKILMYSFDFDEIENLQHKNKWTELGNLLTDTGKQLKGAGADFLAICTNTMHKVADEIEAKTGLKVMHIADITAENILRQNKNTIGLLGTNFTMEEDFYKKRIKDKYNINIIIPGKNDRDSVHRIIYEELCHGIVKEDSKAVMINIVNNLKKSGAEGIISGCTEIPMIISQNDFDIPVFDSAKLHSAAIVKEMLAI